VNSHTFEWITEIDRETRKLRRVGSACIRCGARVYGWGGPVGPCLAEIA
jgi:hypothetical protein